MKYDEEKLLVEKKDDVENLEEKLEKVEEILEDVVKENEDDVDDVEVNELLVVEERELEGGTHGEPVHWLGPGPAMITQALLRHSVCVGGSEDELLLELDDGGTHGDPVH